MGMKHHWILKRTTALIAALLMLLSVLPQAVAASIDWSELQIALNWTDENGEPASAAAIPVTETENGEGCFWVKIPQEALYIPLTISIYHPQHTYEFSPADGSMLEGVMDAGEYLDTAAFSYIPVSAYDPENNTTEVFLLFVSTVTDTPELVTPEPEPTEEITPEPEPTEYITPEPEPTELITPEPEPTEYITSEPEPTAYIAPEPEPMDEITAEPGPTEEISPEPTATPEEDTEMPVGELINRYGITTKKVNFRKGPSTDAGKHGELPKDKHVYLIYSEYNEKNELWTKVEVDGTSGYLMSEYLRMLPQSESNAYDLAQSSPAPLYTMDQVHPTEAVTPEPAPTDTPEPEIMVTDTPAPTDTPEPTATAEPTLAPVITEGEMINRYGMTNKGKVNVRSEPSVDSTKVTTLEKKGEHVYLLRAEKNESNESWTQVQINSSDGYIKTDLLDLLTQEDSDAYDRLQGTPAPVYSEEQLATPTPVVTEEPVPTDTPTAPPTETPEPTIPVGEMLNRYGATRSKVWFRKDASTNAEKIKELSKNTQVYLIYTFENELGETWTYAMVDGTTGYIMTNYLRVLTEEDSAAIDRAQATQAPAFTLEDIFPTEEPSPVVTLEPTKEPPVEPTDTPEPTATQAPEPTDTPEPEITEAPAPTDTPEPEVTEAPAATDTPEPETTEAPVPTDTPEPAATEAAAVTDTPAPEATEAPAPTDTPTAAPTDTPEPTAAPTDTPAPTAEPTQTPVPYQRIGYAITIGDGIPVRQWPTSASSIISELPANKIVYVTGQAYVDDTAWSAAEFDGRWGYVRADMLRMISAQEMEAFADLIRNTVTPPPDTTVAPYTYDADEMSCYGYVTTDAVNFREGPDTNSRKIRQMKRYALFLVYGSEQVNGVTWYRVSYDGQTGYLNGKYFKQMTVGEAEEFFASSKYTEGIANNKPQSADNGQTVQTTGSPTGIVSAEDQKVSEWVNPATGSTVSYEPFDPFATPSPLSENELEKNEFVNSLLKQVQEGTLKQEDVETELGKFYKDAQNPEESVANALAYIQQKLGTETEQPSESPDPLATEEITEFPQEQSSGGSIGWIIALLLLAGAAGGGYYWYSQTQKKREAAQRMARKKAAESRGQQSRNQQAPDAGKTNAPVSAQNAAKVRTGTYTDKPGSVRPKATPTEAAPERNARKPYSTGSGNPYGRYTSSDNEENATYTASFKPGAGKNTAGEKDTEAKDGNNEE